MHLNIILQFFGPNVIRTEKKLKKKIFKQQKFKCGGEWTIKSEFGVKLNKIDSANSIFYSKEIFRTEQSANKITDKQKKKYFFLKLGESTFPRTITCGEINPDNYTRNIFFVENENFFTRRECLKSIKEEDLSQGCNVNSLINQEYSCPFTCKIK